MSEDNLDHKNLPMISDGDGFDRTETDSRIITGTIVKCVDGHWSGRDGLPAPQTPLLAVGTLTVFQRWEEQRPDFKIVDWRSSGTSAATPRIEPPTTEQVLDDALPY